MLQVIVRTVWDNVMNSGGVRDVPSSPSSADANSLLPGFEGIQSWIVLFVASMVVFIYAQVLFPPGPSFTFSWLIVGGLAYLSGSDDAKALFYLMGFGLICGWYSVQIFISGTWERLLCFWEDFVPRWAVGTLIRAGDFLVHVIPFALVMNQYDKIAPRHLIQAIAFERIYFFCVEGCLIGQGHNTNTIYELRPRAPAMLFHKLQMFSTVGYCFASSVCAVTSTHRSFLQAFWILGLLCIGLDKDGLLFSRTINALVKTNVIDCFNRMPSWTGLVLFEERFALSREILQLFSGPEWTSSPSQILEKTMLGVPSTPNTRSRKQHHYHHQSKSNQREKATAYYYCHDIVNNFKAWGPPTGVAARSANLLDSLAIRVADRLRLAKIRKRQIHKAIRTPEATDMEMRDRLANTHDILRFIADRESSLRPLKERLHETRKIVDILDSFQAATAN